MPDLTKMSVEELLARIVSTYQSMSPGPYQWGIIPSDSDQAKYVADLFAHGSGDVHMVILPQHPGSVIGDDPMRPEHAIHLCVTGNGPSSEANARGLVEILTLIRHITRRMEVGVSLPKTADGFAVYPGLKVWFNTRADGAVEIANHEVVEMHKDHVVCEHFERATYSNADGGVAEALGIDDTHDRWHLPYGRIYSTREAALAAKGVERE